MAEPCETCPIILLERSEEDLKQLVRRKRPLLDQIIHHIGFDRALQGPRDGRRAAVLQQRRQPVTFGSQLFNPGTDKEIENKAAWGTAVGVSAAIMAICRSKLPCNSDNRSNRSIAFGCNSPSNRLRTALRSSSMSLGMSVKGTKSARISFSSQPRCSSPATRASTSCGWPPPAKA